MNKSIHYLFLMTLALFITACGSDSNLSGSASSSSTSTLNKSCGCTSSFMPVCDNSKNISYENSCLASCYGATKTIQGNCICTNMPVCGNDGQTYTECGAQAEIRINSNFKITKFTDCNATPL